MVIPGVERFGRAVFLPPRNNEIDFLLHGDDSLNWRYYRLRYNTQTISKDSIRPDQVLVAISYAI
jgi:hypothetical protein